MPIPQRLLDSVAAIASDTNDTLTLPWPGTATGVKTFSMFSEWRDAILDLTLRSAVPEIIRAKFERAQKLYLFGWIDADLIKAGELVSLTALELALTDQYGRKAQSPSQQKSNRKPTLDALVRYMVKADGLTDGTIPMVRRYGGS